MGTEVERKWLCSLNALIELTKDKKYRFEKIENEQFYLITDTDIELRVRSRKGNEPTEQYFLTVKSDGNLSRKEIEISINEDAYINAKSFLKGKKPITKTTYNFSFRDGLYLEVSKIDDTWWYAEIEFKNEEAAKAFFFKDTETFSKYFEEVTFDSAYKMKNYWKRTRGE